MNINEAKAIAGTLGYPSKMPGTSYGISAHKCLVGAKLAKIAGSVCHGCYALRGHYIYSAVAKAHAKRLKGISNPNWVAAMVTLLERAHARGVDIARGWHRWHDSGDLQSVLHLTKICAVAALTPKIRHWLPTRELAIVKAYENGGGTVPSNLLIRVSATMVDGSATATWLHTSTVHTAKAPTGAHVCPAPKQGNNCGKCRACWSRGVIQVSYHKH